MVDQNIKGKEVEKLKVVARKNRKRDKVIKIIRETLDNAMPKDMDLMSNVELQTAFMEVHKELTKVVKKQVHRLPV